VEPGPGPDEVARLVRSLAPTVLAALLRRSERFDVAEDAVQEAMIEALRTWREHPPRDPRAWLTAVARRRLIDAQRSESARRDREVAVARAPAPGATEQGDDTLLLLVWCCHPDLSPSSQVALTLRAVGGLTTREIADAFFVPEATMAQRISRAKATIRGRSFTEPGDLASVLRVLSLVYNAGHGRPNDLVTEAIRLTRQLTLATDEPEARGLLALLLLQHARLPARKDAQGWFVPLDEQDRARWDTAQIAEGVAVLQSALAQERHGRYQILAAISALHSDAASADETDWPQILEWYDELLALSADPSHDDPAGVLNRAVAVGHVAGIDAGLGETDRVLDVLGDRAQWHAVRAYLCELGGDPAGAADHYAAAAARTNAVAEREHLVRRAARAHAAAAPHGPA
jgi:RNA polymerase sigma factor (sigma-70 family)